MGLLQQFFFVAMVTSNLDSPSEALRDHVTLKEHTHLQPPQSKSIKPMHFST